MATTISFTSCTEDKLEDTIFDPTDYPLDRSAYTFPLDTFIKVNFLEPYNLRFVYRMEDVGSDLNKNLVPASYQKSVELAVLTKYLWYDVYKKHAGAEFLRQYSPRIIHVIGSKNINASQGTEVAGVTEGGIKITLYNTNGLDAKNLQLMNDYFFGTMHHEFGHVLDQNRLHPTDFNTISSGHYNSSSWQETSDSISLGLGFVTSYGSSATGEDWVEIIANYITLSPAEWEAKMNTACYEWEEIDYDATYMSRRSNGDRDTVGYVYPKANGDMKIVRRKCMRDPETDYCLLDSKGEVQWSHETGIDGKATIERKLAMVRDWMKTYFKANLDSIRNEVHSRQFVTDAAGNVQYDVVGKVLYPQNKLVEKQADGRTFMEHLTDEVEQYKALQSKQE
jgi:substrate import-associated zinc metallohydrolase lipoprotein